MRNITVLGAFPPPYHGSSIITKAIVEILKSEFVVNQVNSSLSKKNKDIGRLQVSKFVHMLNLCFRCLLNRNHTTIYWCPAPNGIAFLKDSLLFILLKLFSKSKVIIHIHARGFEIDSALVLWFKSRLLRDSKVFCVSQDMKNTLVDSFRSNYYCVWNPVLLKPNLKQVSRDLDLLFVGNMFKQKGPLEFIEVVRIVKEQYPGITAAMVGAEGDISFAEIEKNIIESHLEDNINFIGPMDHSELSEMYIRSKILIFPSVYEKESFGLVVAEAMTFGTPSIIYNQWGVRNLIDNGINGYICEANDSGAMASRVKRLLGTEDEWTLMSRQSKLIAHERFSLKNYEDTILQLINASE
jgi:glycosyltransferase involved in cell wall biosynthesis